MERQSSDDDDPGSPSILGKIGFYVHDVEKVWALDVPSEEVGIDELAWHLDQPILWSSSKSPNDLTPRQAIENLQMYPKIHRRIIEADESYAIDVMRWQERWLIVDGMHRLMKKVLEGSKTIVVRKIPESSVPMVPIEQTN